MNVFWPFKYSLLSLLESERNIVTFLIGVSRFAKKFFLFLIRMFKNATEIASIAHPTHLANALKMLMWILLKTC